MVIPQEQMERTRNHNMLMRVQQMLNKLNMPKAIDIYLFSLLLSASLKDIQYSTLYNLIFIS